jgi:hypothetical protein
LDRESDKRSGIHVIANSRVRRDRKLLCVGVINNGRVDQSVRIGQSDKEQKSNHFSENELEKKKKKRKKKKEKKPKKKKKGKARKRRHSRKLGSLSPLPPLLTYIHAMW